MKKPVTTAVDIRGVSQIFSSDQSVNKNGRCPYFFCPVLFAPLFPSHAWGSLIPSKNSTILTNSLKFCIRIHYDSFFILNRI